MKLKISGFNQKSHIAYLGVNNSIELIPSDQSKPRLQLRTTNGKFITSSSSLKYRPDHLGPAIMEAFIVQNKDTLVVKTFNIAIEYLPFTFTIGSQTTYFKDIILIPLEEFRNNHFAMYSINTNLSAIGKIFGFELCVSRNKKEIFNEDFGIYTRKTASVIKDKLHFLQSEDLLYFDKLKYSYLDDSLISYKPFRIFIQ